MNTLKLKFFVVAVCMAMMLATSSNIALAESNKIDTNQFLKLFDIITIDDFCKCFSHLCCKCEDGTYRIKEDDVEKCPCCKKLSKTCCGDTTIIIEWNSCEVEPVCPVCPCDPSTCDGIKVSFRIFNPYADFQGNGNHPKNPYPGPKGLTYVEQFVNLVSKMGGKTCCEGVTEWKQVPCEIVGSDAYIDACVPNKEMAQAIIVEWSRKGLTPGNKDFASNRYEGGEGGYAGDTNINVHPNAFGINSWYLLDDNYEIRDPRDPLDGSYVRRCQCLAR